MQVLYSYGLPPNDAPAPMSEMLDDLDARHAQLLSELDELNERVESAIEQHGRKAEK